MRYENVETNQWSYKVVGCTEDEYNVRFLKNVPHEKVKSWVITKTATHLNVRCNKVTVLNFDFAVDSDPDQRDGEKIWSRKADSFKIGHAPYKSLLLRSV